MPALFMHAKQFPFIFALLIFFPIALVLIIIVLLGLKLKMIEEKDVSIISLLAVIGFLLAVLFFQKFFGRAWERA